MIYGFLLVLVTGIQWAFLNISMSRARHSVKDFTPFYVIGGLTALLLIGLSNLFLGCRVLPETLVWRPILLVILGSCINVGTNVCVMSTLGYGASALYLALSSMGFAVSFLWTVGVMKEPFTLFNAMGMTCLCTAVALAAFARQQGEGAVGKAAFDFKRLGIAVLSTLCGGSSQICLISAGSDAQLPALGKTAFTMLTYVTVFGIAALVRRASFRENRRILCQSAVTWGTLAMTSYATLFLAIKFLAEISRSGIAYPIGTTVQLTAFTLYTRIFLKERLTLMQITALVLIAIGVFAVKL